MGRLKLHVLSPIVADDEPPAVPADDDALLLALSSPPPVSDEPLPDELLAPPPVPDELPADVKAALLVAVDAPEQRYDALVKVPSFKAASVFQRAPSRAAPSLKTSANLSASSEPAAAATTTTTAITTNASTEESLPPPPPLPPAPHESISVVSPVLPAAPSVLSPRSLDSGVKPAPPRGAPPTSAATKAPADDEDDSSTESMDSEKAPMATAIKFGMLPSAQKDEDKDAGRFEDFFKVSGDVDIALLSARRRQQAADDSDSDDGKATPPIAGGAELPSGATKSKSRRHGASSSSAAAAAASSSSSSSRHTSGSSTAAVSSSSSSRRSKTDKSDNSKPAEIVKSGESTSSRRSRTNTRGRSGTTIVADGRPAPPDGAPPVVSPLALSTTADAPDPGSLSDSAPSPRRRRHHHSSKRRAELQAEIADVKRALSDPNTPDMAPYRARLQKAEAELRELDHIAPADDTVAVAVVAAAAASALASGSALPEAQKELLEKAQQMMGERQAQAQLATNAVISPRRARGNTTSRTEAPEKVVIQAPSPADVLRELKIRKMLLVGQIGTLKKQLATPTLSGDERKRAEGSLKLIEADMVKLDDDIKARTVESAAPIAIVQTPRK
jgi:hypothetical protein